MTVPYEHATFVRRLEDLRYEGGESDQRRLDMIQQTAVDMARLLGSVPGFEGSMRGDPETLLQLGLVLSASELALLPFELAKMPHGREYPGDNWLALQTQVALCITRHIRSVPRELVKWSATPRILFVAGDPDNIPLQEHRQALREAIEPWEGLGTSKRVTLDVLENASIADVKRACLETDYTHIHVLTHGDVQPNNPDKFGIRLRDSAGSEDVIPGDQFATAISTMRDGGVHRPTVVTVASCDSGNLGSVLLRGASFAHDLHQSGIPLVVASQFPLSKPGSVVMTRTLYRELLMAENPIITLHRVRAELHSLYGAESARLGQPGRLRGVTARTWTSSSRNSVIGAPRMPPTRSSRRSTHCSAAEGRSMRLGSEELVDDVERARDRLPIDGPYATECLGLRASMAKRLAEAKFRAALLPGTSETRPEESACLVL